MLLKKHMILVWCYSWSNESVRSLSENTNLIDHLSNLHGLLLLLLKEEEKQWILVIFMLESCFLVLSCICQCELILGILKEIWYQWKTHMIRPLRRLPFWSSAFFSIFDDNKSMLDSKPVRSRSSYKNCGLVPWFSIAWCSLSSKLLCFMSKNFVLIFFCSSNELPTKDLEKNIIVAELGWNCLQRKCLLITSTSLFRLTDRWSPCWAD